MEREKINKIYSHAVFMPYNNIDTDQIIPAEFLKITKKDNLANHLFHNFRYESNGSLISDFPLNKEKSKSAKILITSENFGCGSSREHAAWALYDYGFRVIVAKSFADIFKNNAYNIGLLPIKIEEEFYKQIEQQYTENLQFKVDLFYQTLTIINSFTDTYTKFSISPYRRECLLNGYDNVGYLLNMKSEINRYEQKIIQP